MTKRPDLESAYGLNTPDDSRRLYRDWAESYDADFVEAHGFRMPARIAEVWLAAGGAGPALDVGCGTGAVGRHLGHQVTLDGLDISPEMLAVARRTGAYRAFYEADLTQPLNLPKGAWAGLVSSGTFTTGHVGPAALAPLLDLLRPGARVALTVKTSFYAEAGFAPVLEDLEARGRIAGLSQIEEPIYTPGRAPQGHDDDTGLILSFLRL